MKGLGRASFAPVWVLCAVLLGAFASAASAAPINYVESISGDLPTVYGTPLTTFTFDVGANTISGTITGAEVGFDHDSFAFIVPSGMQVVRISIVAADVEGLMAAVAWSLGVGSPNFGGGTELTRLNVPSPGNTEYTNILGPQVYNMSEGGFTFANEGGVSSYTFTFDVRSTGVPEPAMISLLALGGALLLLRRYVR